MDFSKYTGRELIAIYGELLEAMRAAHLIRSKNVTGDLGEYIAVDYYTRTKGLPRLQFAPPSTKNVDALSVDGERYSIKCTTTNTTGVFYGIGNDVTPQSIRPLFEHVIIVKLSDTYQPELIAELDWDTFLKYRHWHSRMKAYNLIITNALLQDAKIIFRKEDSEEA